MRNFSLERRDVLRTAAISTLVGTPLVSTTKASEDPSLSFDPGGRRAIGEEKSSNVMSLWIPNGIHLDETTDRILRILDSESNSVRIAPKSEAEIKIPDESAVDLGIYNGDGAIKMDPLISSPADDFPVEVTGDTSMFESTPVFTEYTVELAEEDETITSTDEFVYGIAHPNDAFSQNTINGEIEIAYERFDLIDESWTLLFSLSDYDRDDGSVLQRYTSTFDHVDDTFETVVDTEEIDPVPENGFRDVDVLFYDRSVDPPEDNIAEEENLWAITDIEISDSDRPPGEPGLEASFTFEPETPNIGDTVTFDASGSEPTAEIAEYQWDVTGDGDVDETGETVETVFEQSEEQTVTLTIVDNDGNESSTEETLAVDPLAQIPLKRDRIEEIRQRTTTYLSEETAETEIEQEAEEFVDTAANDYPTASPEEQEQFERALDRMIHAENTMVEAVEAPKGALDDLSSLVIGLSTTLASKKLITSIGDSSTFEKLQGWIAKRGSSVSEDVFDGLVGAGTTDGETLSAYQDVSEGYQADLSEELVKISAEQLGQAATKAADEEFGEAVEVLPDEVTDLVDNAVSQVGDVFEETTYTAYLKGVEGTIETAIPEPGDIVIPEDDSYTIDIPDELTDPFGIVPDEFDVPVSPPDADIPDVPDTSDILELRRQVVPPAGVTGIDTRMDREIETLATRVENGEVEDVDSETLASVEETVTSLIQFVGEFAENLTSIMRTVSTFVGDLQDQMVSYTTMIAAFGTDIPGTEFGRSAQLKAVLAVGKIVGALGAILLKVKAASILITVGTFWLIDLIHSIGAKAMLNTDVSQLEGI